MRNNAASHHHTHTHTHTHIHSTVTHVWGYVSGHGGGGGGDDEGEVEEYVKAEIRWRRAAIDCFARLCGVEALGCIVAKSHY